VGDLDMIVVDDDPHADERRTAAGEVPQPVLLRDGEQVHRGDVTTPAATRQDVER
jgi:hypothetical protein